MHKFRPYAFKQIPFKCEKQTVAADKSERINRKV